MMILVLVLGEDDAVEIAADQVAENDAAVHAENLPCMRLPERNRNAEVIERICNAVGESANDEERDSKEHW